MIELSYNEIASMLQDIRASRTVFEIDDINGQVVYDAEKFGIAVPFNEVVVLIVKSILWGELRPELANLKYFNIPELEG